MLAERCRLLTWLARSEELEPQPSDPALPRAQVRIVRVSVDSGIRFPGESSEYRLARNRLLESEIELRRMIERVAAQRRALVVVAKSDPARIRDFAQERGWRHRRLLSSRNNNVNRDYHAQTPEGEQLPTLNVFNH